MAAYRFKLEALLNYRRNLEEVALQHLATVKGDLKVAEMALEQAGARRLATVDEFEQRKKRPMLPVRFAWFMDSLRQQEQMIAAAAAVVERKKAEVDAATTALIERVRQRKVMEKARERDYRKYLAARMAAELKENDEMAVLRYKKSA